MNMNPRVLIIEPFYGGSHKQLIDLIESCLQKGTNETIKCIDSDMNNSSNRQFVSVKANSSERKINDVIIDPNGDMKGQVGDLEGQIDDLVTVQDGDRGGQACEAKGQTFEQENNHDGGLSSDLEKGHSGDLMEGQSGDLVESKNGDLEKGQCGSDLEKGQGEHYVKVTLPAKKWHWRARTSALYFADAIPWEASFRVLFCSSVLNLAELIALRPDLGGLKKIIYFHENQLEYPVRKHQDRDFQYGYNQILSCLVADQIVFNSAYNMESFLKNINSHLKLIPDHRPKGIPEKIRPKCSVLYFPLDFNKMAETLSLSNGKNLTSPEKEMAAKDKIPKHQYNQKQIHLPSENTSIDKLPSCKEKEEKEMVANDRLSKYQDNQNSVQSHLSSENPAPDKIPDVNTVDNELAFQYVSTAPQAKEINREATSEAKLLANENTSEKTNENITVSSEHISDFNLPNEFTRETMRVDSSNGLGMYPHMNSEWGPRKRLQIVLENEADDRCPEKRPSWNENESPIGGTVCDKPLHIVWPHRWEHDKGPDELFHTLFTLQDEGLDFRVSILGEMFTDVPDIFAIAKDKLGSKILYWGYLPTKRAYFEVLRSADIVVSTAKHEFFGVAMIEAAFLGCYPLCPNRLVYPEIFPDDYLYNTDNQLLKKLRRFCKMPQIARNTEHKFNLERFSWTNVREDFVKLLS